MKLDKKQLKNVLTAADAISTFNGGMSMINVKLSKGEDNIRVDVTAPGISAESFRVDINNDRLYIYYLLNLKNDEEKAVPYVIKALSIPFNVDIHSIWATYKNGKLSVYMPYNEFARGFQKSVDIYS
jgi:HSP20 family protein